MITNFYLSLRRSAFERWLPAVMVMALHCTLMTTPIYAQSNPQPISEAALIRQVKAYVGQLVAEEKFSGALLIAKAGQPILTQAFGLASIAHQTPNRIDTKFNLGSMNKMFTAVAIAQLAEQGKLAFNDPIAKHLPDYPNQAVATKVTIHHLLTHTSGLADYFNDKFMEASRARFRTVQDFFPLFVDEPLQFAPGSRWAYSNSNFIVLGAIIEAVSGQAYFDYVREQIYQPAGMINTDAYELDHEIPNLATGYTRAPGESEWRNNLFEHVIKGGPAGGGYSTVEDLLRFAQALTEHRLLSAESTVLITTGKVAIPHRDDAQYAYGFGVETINGYRRFGHSGGFTGINSQLNIYPELGYVVVVMGNYDPPAASRVAERIGKLITGSAIPQPIRLTDDELRAYAQPYTRQGEGLGPRGITVVAEDGALWLTIGSDRHRFLPLSPTEFYDEEVEEVRMKFTLDEQGQPTGLTLEGASPEPVPYVAAPEGVAPLEPITLPAATLQNYAQTYVRVGAGPGPDEVQLVAEAGGLWTDLGGERHQFLPLSPVEFYDEQFDEVRLQFTLDDKGRPTAVTVEGAAPESIKYIVKSNADRAD